MVSFVVTLVCLGVLFLFAMNCGLFVVVLSLFGFDCVWSWLLCLVCCSCNSVVRYGYVA